jgi:hypothetical protein
MPPSHLCMGSGSLLSPRKLPTSRHTHTHTHTLPQGTCPLGLSVTLDTEAPREAFTEASVCALKVVGTRASASGLGSEAIAGW